VSFFDWHITGNLVYAVPRISAVHQLAVDPTILNGLSTDRKLSRNGLLARFAKLQPSIEHAR
jgi:hypothetical protein